MPQMTEAGLFTEGEGRQVLACPADRKCKWKSGETVILLKEMMRYTERNGKCKISKPYLSDFYSSLTRSPIGSTIVKNYKNDQVHNKMKRLKRKFRVLSKSKGPLSPEDKKIVKFGSMLWGEAKKSIEEEKKDDEDMTKDVDVDYGVEDVPEIMLWANEIQDLCEKMFAWPRNYTMLKINGLDRFIKASLSRQWIKEKREIDRATFTMITIEEEFLRLMQSSSKTSSG